MTRSNRSLAGRLKERFGFHGHNSPVPVDVTDRGDTFEVAIDLPGVRKQDIDVTVFKDRLRVVAEPDAGPSGEYLRQERPRKPLRRVVVLPEHVDSEHVSASYEDGVLWVTLRKVDS